MCTYSHIHLDLLTYFYIIYIYIIYTHILCHYDRLNALCGSKISLVVGVWICHQPLGPGYSGRDGYDQMSGDLTMLIWAFQTHPIGNTPATPQILWMAKPRRQLLLMGRYLEAEEALKDMEKDEAWMWIRG